MELTRNGGEKKRQRTPMPITQAQTKAWKQGDKKGLMWYKKARRARDGLAPTIEPVLRTCPNCLENRQMCT